MSSRGDELPSPVLSVSANELIISAKTPTIKTNCYDTSGKLDRKTNKELLLYLKAGVANMLPRLCIKITGKLKKDCLIYKPGRGSALQVLTKGRFNFIKGTTP